MHHEDGISQVVRFGAFAFDRHSSELWKGETRLKVPDQSLQILKTLLERPGQLVTREDLRQRLWPPDTFVDFESLLPFAGRNALMPVVSAPAAGRPGRLVYVQRRTDINLLRIDLAALGMATSSPATLFHSSTRTDNNAQTPRRKGAT